MVLCLVVAVLWLLPAPLCQLPTLSLPRLPSSTLTRLAVRASPTARDALEATAKNFPKAQRLIRQQETHRTTPCTTPSLYPYPAFPSLPYIRLYQPSPLSLTDILSL